MNRNWLEAATAGKASGKRKVSGKSFLFLVAAFMLATSMIFAFAGFSHSSPGWTTPLDISPDSTSNGQQQVALDQYGNLHVVWSGRDAGSESQVYYSRMTTSGWSAPVILSTATTDDYAPQISLDSDGNPHVVWYGQDTDTVYRVWYSENTGSGWTPQAVVSSSLSANRDPQLALDPDGNPHVVWQGEDAGSVDRTYYAKYDGSGWAAPINLSTDSTENHEPQIALDSGGNPHVVWSGRDTGLTMRAWYSTRAGAGWTIPANLSTGTLNNESPRIALDAGGHPHVVWAAYTGVWYSTNGGSGWTVTENVFPGSTYNYSPQLVLDAVGHPHVAWSGEGAGYVVYPYYSENTGSGWATPQSLSPGTSDNGHVQIALDPSGNPHLVWRGRDGSTVKKAWYSENSGGGWTAPLNLSTGGTTDNNYPLIATDAGGNFHVTWCGSMGSESGLVWYSADISTYLVRASVTGGHGTADPAAQWAAAGGSASVDFTPEAGYRVGTVTDNGVRKAATGSYVISDVNEYHEIEVTFTENAFYFAEGYTGAGFQEYLCLGNPGDIEVAVDVTYLFTEGTSLKRTYTVPALSRFTADVNAEVGADKNVSIKCSAATTFVAERPMYFDYTGAGESWTGGHDAVGATSTSDTWYFAEGYTGPGFDEWVCVLNPGDSPASLTFNFQTQEEGLIVPDGVYTVPAHSRATFKANDLLNGESHSTSLKLVSDVPVVAERPMYFNYQGTGSWGWTGGHCVIGATYLARDYYFAEGYTGTGFEEWLTLQNPGSSEITVEASYQLASGTPVPRTYTISAASRSTIYVPSEVGTDQNVSVHLSSTADFLAERPMYFDYQGTASWGWTGGHCVIGATFQGTGWFFAEGYTGDGFEEWLCIQNPGTTAAEVEIVYYPEGGSPINKDVFTVAAGSRYTVNVNADAGAGLSLCAGVFSDQPVIVERPMYFNYGGKWTGGHDVVGYMP